MDLLNPKQPLSEAASHVTARLRFFVPCGSHFPLVYLREDGYFHICLWFSWPCCLLLSHCRLLLWLLCLHGASAHFPLVTAWISWTCAFPENDTPILVQENPSIPSSSHPKHTHTVHHFISQSTTHTDQTFIEDFGIIEGDNTSQHISANNLKSFWSPFIWGTTEVSGNFELLESQPAPFLRVPLPCFVQTTAGSTTVPLSSRVPTKLISFRASRKLKIPVTLFYRTL